MSPSNPLLPANPMSPAIGRTTPSMIDTISFFFKQVAFRAKKRLSFIGHVPESIEETSGRVDITCSYANHRSACSESWQTI